MAAGTSIHHENINPIKNKKPEPIKAGKRRLFSLLVNPGDINKIFDKKYKAMTQLIHYIQQL